MVRDVVAVRLSPSPLSHQLARPLSCLSELRGNRAPLKSWPPAALFLQPGCELCHPAAHPLTAAAHNAAHSHAFKAQTDVLDKY